MKHLQNKDKRFLMDGVEVFTRDYSNRKSLGREIKDLIRDVIVVVALWYLFKAIVIGAVMMWHGLNPFTYVTIF